ncbi:hypothetical protein GCM10007047_27450 [Cerasicoccus arenae]|uniref:Uncharacterized protein n=1 Tax=Cerasicoccus arenae TaxID=424488 RepID=A0A8J3DD86_9BACT|nr:hypothetical protein GCM10007047_27450 [Cerasicoccus arenae]
MPPTPHNLPEKRQNVPFDINRSSFFHFIEAQRDQIKRHQRTESEKSGEEIDPDTIMHSWIWHHRD